MIVDSDMNVALRSGLLLQRRRPIFVITGVHIFALKHGEHPNFINHILFDSADLQLFKNPAGRQKLDSNINFYYISHIYDPLGLHTCEIKKWKPGRSVMDVIRWGIIGTGHIAGKFAADLGLVNGSVLHAVGSRRKDSAETFARRFSIPHYYAGYEQLVEDKAIDVIYIASPHGLHKEHSLLCLEHDKAVLCEKSFTINAAEADEVVSKARAKKLFLMEAMWTRFLPIFNKMRQYLQETSLGKVRSLNAELGFKATFDPGHRLFNPKLGGGALLDLGIYPLSLASFLLNKPKTMDTTAQLGETGVDEQSCILLEYDEDRYAKIFLSLRKDLSNEAIILTEHGRLRLHAPLYRPAGLTVSVIGQKDEYIEAKYEGEGYVHQIREVMQCLRAGKTESALMPLDETLRIMETMDALRGRWGLKYPGEV
jgi:predicted dehydrogenase